MQDATELKQQQLAALIDHGRDLQVRLDKSEAVARRGAAGALSAEQQANLIAQSEQSYLQALDLARELHGEEHETVAQILNLLVSIYSQNRKRHRECRILCKKVIQLGAKSLGTDHSAVLTAMNNLAVIHTLHGAFNKAEDLLKQVLDIRLASLEPNHPLVIRALTNLRELYLRAGNDEKADAVLIRVAHTARDIVSRQLQSCSDHKSTTTSRKLLPAADSEPSAIDTPNQPSP